MIFDQFSFANSLKISSCEFYFCLGTYTGLVIFLLLSEFFLLLISRFFSLSNKYLNKLMHSLIIKSEAREPNAPMAMKPLVVLMVSDMAYFTFNASN